MFRMKQCGFLYFHVCLMCRVQPETEEEMLAVAHDFKQCSEFEMCVLIILSTQVLFFFLFLNGLFIYI